MYADQPSQSVRTRGASKHFESADFHMLLCRRAFLCYVLLPCLKYSPLSFQHTALQERAQSLLGSTASQTLPQIGTLCPRNFACYEQRGWSTPWSHCRLDEEASLLARTGAYKLMQYIYEHIDGKDIKSKVLGPAGGEHVSSTVGCLATHTRNSHDMFMYI